MRDFLKNVYTYIYIHTEIAGMKFAICYTKFRQVLYSGQHPASTSVTVRHVIAGVMGEGMVLHAVSEQDCIVNSKFKITIIFILGPVRWLCR